MGASGSKTAVAPILPATQLSAAQVADAVRALGESYIPYAEKLEKDGMDGPTLDAITADDLPGLLADIGVTSTFHQKKLEVVFKSFKSGGNGDDSDGSFSDDSEIARLEQELEDLKAEFDAAKESDDEADEEGKQQPANTLEGEHDVGE